ncbi:MAG: hypothetical protein R3D52_06835 [Xanthobacteraceae bacterium]
MRAVVPAGAENLQLELQLASPSSQTLIGLISTTPCVRVAPAAST